MSKILVTQDTSDRAIFLGWKCTDTSRGSRNQEDNVAQTSRLQNRSHHRERQRRRRYEANAEKRSDFDSLGNLLYRRVDSSLWSGYMCVLQYDVYTSWLICLSTL
ncbi:PREDICTED: uncharacterized protein LOC108554911 [Eufriesea mexicana]|uniref:uncharacterized protein LOC108554911 n=1 Tax=Eufriesea mexicana TaxID=516756 RepID=UPI00083C1BBF|nr:PREDICTED: uncharacterized protein LOC108554911 [Eufriesea mexicana]